MLSSNYESLLNQAADRIAFVLSILKLFCSSTVQGRTSLCLFYIVETPILKGK